MAKKISTMTVTFPHVNPQEAKAGVNELYRIEKVTDSVEFNPKQRLTKAQVEELCEDKHWKVTVLAYKGED